MKKYICMLLICSLFVSCFCIGYAGNGEGPVSYDGPSMDYHGPGDGKSIFEMSPEEREAENAPQGPSTRAVSYYNTYALVTASTTQNVYSSASTTSTKAGVVDPRERVYVYYTDPFDTFYYIRFLGPNHDIRYGYVAKNAIYIPRYGYTRPITTGTVTQQYSGNHNGVDIAASSGTNLYAVTSGTAEFKYHLYDFGDGSGLKLVSYGKFVDLKTGTRTFRYGHLSSFAGNVSEVNYPSSGYYNDTVATTVHRNLTSRSAGTKSISTGSIIGKVGNTGCSTGNHLHFEVRNSNVTADPWLYVVFPDIGW